MLQGHRIHGKVLARLRLGGWVRFGVALPLPDDEREVILLRHFQELPWERIRVLLDRPTVAAAQQLKARALRRLGELLLRRRDDLPSGFSWV